ncbi:hypothetical protein [Azohydromonas lata]|uniref:hypothetical protein n=1 Tax=Azohydromonas lata TaxID=45677 RepID=UPI001470E89F|nr:hypothetical protein [Azohydromonas lata]
MAVVKVRDTAGAMAVAARGSFSTVGLTKPHRWATARIRHAVQAGAGGETSTESGTRGEAALRKQHYCKYLKHSVNKITAVFLLEKALSGRGPGLAQTTARPVPRRSSAGR